MPITVMLTKATWRLLGGRGQLIERSPTEDENHVLGDWSAKAVRYSEGQYLLMVNERTMLCLLVPWASSTDMIWQMFVELLGELLLRIGIPKEVALGEVRQLRIQVGKNRNRSLLGSLNDLEYLAEAFVEGRNLESIATLMDVNLKLSRVPHVRRKPAFGDDAARALLGGFH